MKKLMTLIALLLVTGNIFASELGEDLSADCVSTIQSSRNQEVLADGQETREAPAASTVR